ncbi:M23 family metallopeptidase [Psychroserpens jangbogonensis]|uniref:M23 family metallopeptidase n=1 Tax=Psychroserpens jangbogonensis TaxID=1484460 RepID=UPI0009DD82F0|nr:M23 family metallopeptidase [Psychroserpens jangbogonensis]
MKLLFTFLLTVVSLSIYSQKIPDLKIVDQLDFEVIKKADSTDTIIKLDTIAPIDIKAENWDHTVYNPFKNEVVMFPLQLEFKDSTYASPISKNKVVTSRYGWRRGRGHKGIDIDLITGDSLFSMFDGIVRMSRYSRGHGKTVVVRHYNGLETVYAHLSAYGVKENDSVFKGQYLGKGGVSGNARGSHLHLVVNYKGIAINPEYLFEFNDSNSIRSNEIWVTQQWTRTYVHNSKRQSKIIPLLTEEDAITSLKKQKKIYVVKRGDTLSRISKRNNITIAAICKTNAINKNSVIKPGQKLVIEK